MFTRQQDSIIMPAQQIKAEHCRSVTPRSWARYVRLEELCFRFWPVKATTIHVKKSLLHSYSFLKFSDLEVWCQSQDVLCDWHFPITMIRGFCQQKFSVFQIEFEQRTSLPRDIISPSQPSVTSLRVTPFNVCLGLLIFIYHSDMVMSLSSFQSQISWQNQMNFGELSQLCS